MAPLLRPLPLLLFTACSWFAASEPAATADATRPGQDPADLLPKCRPADAVETRGEVPFKVGASTPGGWTVTAVDVTNVEYIRVTFKKEATETSVEIAYNEAGEGDWATKDYKLMPAPAQTPPDDLLKEVIGQLREWQGKQTQPFVTKKAGIIDPYLGLPPCGGDGQPQ